MQLFPRRPIRTLTLFGLTVVTTAIACANVVEPNPDQDDNVRATGGSQRSTGGRSSGDPTGGKDSGGTSGGGTNASGGTENASTGGRAHSGGTGTGGDDAGEVSYEGDCNGLPDVNDQGIATGDFAVHVCEKDQSACTLDLYGQPALFQCTDEHANNCVTQDPSGGNSWRFVKLCSELVGMGGSAMGGMGGMGGQP